MAGKLNHIIPQWLQKGFASQIKGKGIFTFAYRKDKEPFEINIGNNLAENYFYGRKGELNADDVMTDIETYKLSPLINKLRDGNCNFNDSKTEIAELISHFSIRTKTTRKGFEEMSEKTLKGFKEILTDEETISEVLLKPERKVVENIFEETLNNPPPELNDALHIFQMLGLEKDDVKDFITDLTFSNLKNEETETFVKDIFSSIFDQSVKELPNSIKKGHNEALLNSSIPPKRVEHYEKLTWNVYKVNSPLILGDVACIFREIGDELFKSSCEISKTGQVYFPISSSQILVGSLDSETIEIDVNILNQAIAMCSYEQFICCENSKDKTALIEFIGKNFYLASDEEIKVELDEMRKNVEMFKLKKDSLT